MVPRDAIWVLAIVASILGGRGTVQAAPADWQPLVRGDAQPTGALSCASASCHGREADRPAADLVGREAYSRWLQFDPHAKAARTLQTPRFRQILTAVSAAQQHDAASDAVYRRCAACHDPQGLAGVGKGIGCESCHGPAENWLAVHFERDIEREELKSLGMIDTKNLLVRGRLCAACHVGGEDQDMNHDMIAAGHPPLRFELSAYHDKIERKHWTDAERIEPKEFKAQLWSAGQLATAEATLALTASRATRAAAGERLTPWPEFAEYDCFGCHQRLRPAGGPSTVALKSTTAGVPGWQPWNLALTRAVLGENYAEIARTSRIASRSLFAAADEVRLAAAAAQQAIQGHPPLFLNGEQLLAVVEEAQADQPWAARGQQLLALHASYLTWRDENRKQTGIAALDDAWDREFLARLHDLGAAIRFGSTEFEWPAYDWTLLRPTASAPHPQLDAAQVEQELKRLAGELRARFNGRERL